MLLWACGDGDIRVIPDPAVQRANDIEIIEEFFMDKGYSPNEVDTTESGVRYVILDPGKAELGIVDENDIVSFHYIGKLATDTLFDTTIESIAETSSIYDETRNYAPLVITYTSSGWTIQGLFVRGFSDGITCTFNKMKIGGRALIAMPSNLGYGSSPPFGSKIPSNAVLTFELLPVKVRKQ